MEKFLAQLPAESIAYTTARGAQLCGDSRGMLEHLPPDSVDLIVTSPPFALLRKKAYGNEDQDDYIDWLVQFGRAAYRVLKSDGSFVLDLGGAYQRGRPVRSLYNFRVLLRFCDELGYRLAEEFFWHNPSKLPSPIEWVNKRKIRVKDSVNTIWWFSKTDWPKADVRRVLVPYSSRMKKLLEDPARFYRPKERPSGHDIGDSFSQANGGAIPSNLLRIPNTESNSHYLRCCKELGMQGHPARYPSEVPQFFIEFLTSRGDLVLDIFSGSNTTGHVAERLGRSWISIELDRDYAALSSVRFLEGCSYETTAQVVRRISQGEAVHIPYLMPDLAVDELELPLPDH